MKYEDRAVISWLQSEFGAKENPSKPGEYIFDCPFCDPHKTHGDYGFNVEKRVGNCWRGFDKRCQSGHTLPGFISTYYKLGWDSAKEFIENKFNDPNSLRRLRKQVDITDENRRVETPVDKVSCPMPREVVPITQCKTKESRRAYRWLKKTRKIPPSIIDLIEPKFLHSRVNDRRWKAYADRVFFPVVSQGNTAWLAYSTEKKSTKEKPKTRNPPGSVLSRLLYLYDFYLQSEEPIVICEGLFDALRLFIFGYNATCVFGTNISPAQIELLNSLPAKEVVVCLDPDAVDRRNKMCRNLRKYYFGRVSFMQLDDGDPDETSYDVFTHRFHNRLKYNPRLYGVKKLAI